jgi:tetratricopeptide (TPR) repeat protein
MKIFIKIVIFIFALNLYGVENVGTHSAVFLKIPVSARSVGLGESSTAIYNNAFSIYENPSLLAFLYNMEIAFSHIEWIADTSYEFLSFAKPLNKPVLNYIPTIAFAISYLHLPFFKSYNSWGEIIGDASFSDFAFSLAYSQKVREFKTGSLYAGINLKIIAENLNENYDTALTITPSFLYSFKVPPITIFRKRVQEQPINIGFVIENYSLGTKIAGSSTTPIYKIGIGLTPFKNFAYSLDFHIPLDNRLRINSGIEYTYKNLIFLRFGYKFFGYEVDTFGIGAGTFLELGNKILKFDISYAPISILGNNLIFSFILKYSGEIPEEKKKIIYIFYYKGIYYYLRKEYDEAIKMWKKCLETDPNFKPAIEKISNAEYLKKLQQVEEKIPEKYKPKE